MQPTAWLAPPVMQMRFRVALDAVSRTEPGGKVLPGVVDNPAQGPYWRPGTNAEGSENALLSALFSSSAGRSCVAGHPRRSRLMSFFSRLGSSVEGHCGERTLLPTCKAKEIVDY